MSETKLSRSLWVVFGLIVACAACCAVPLLGVLGLGAVASATLATFLDSEFKILLIVGSLATLAGVMAILLRRRWRGDCKTDCAPDGSCCGTKAPQK